MSKLDAERQVTDSRQMARSISDILHMVALLLTTGLICSLSFEASSVDSLKLLQCGQSFVLILNESEFLNKSVELMNQ